MARAGLFKKLLRSMTPSQILWWPRYYAFYRRLKKSDGKLLMLDAGCGEGVVAHGLSRRGFRVIGVDRHPGVIRKTPAVSGSAFLACDIASLPFKDASFGLVFSLDVLDTIKDPGRVFREFSRVLKKDGRLIFSIPDGHVCSAELFAVQRLLRKLTPPFLRTREMPGNKAWLETTSEELARKLGCVENYSSDIVINEARKFFCVSHREYLNKAFTSFVTDIVYGIKGAYYLRVPLFFMAVRLDRHLFKRARGYTLFYEMRK